MRADDIRVAISKTEHTAPVETEHRDRTHTRRGRQTTVRCSRSSLEPNGPNASTSDYVTHAASLVNERRQLGRETPRRRFESNRGEIAGWQREHLKGRFLGSALP
ncbi:hypothetical protein MRX96_000395 [Rhipicephalus microplus]